MSQGPKNPDNSGVIKELPFLLLIYIQGKSSRKIQDSRHDFSLEVKEGTLAKGY